MIKNTIPNKLCCIKIMLKLPIADVRRNSIAKILKNNFAVFLNINIFISSAMMGSYACSLGSYSISVRPKLHETASFAVFVFGGTLK